MNTAASSQVTVVDSRRWYLETLVTLIQVAAVFGVLLLMAHTLANVAGRYFFNTPLRGTNEIVAFWYLPLIAFPGFVAAQVLNRHISANILFDMLPKKNQREVAIGIALIGAALCGTFAYYTFQEALHSMAQGRHVVGTSAVIVWPTTFLPPIAFGSLCVLFLMEMANLIMGRAIQKDQEQLELERLGIAEEEAKPAEATKGQRWLVRAAIIGAIAICLVAMFAFEAKQVIALGAVGLMLVLLFLKVPVAFSLAGPGLLGLWAIRPRAVFTMLENQPFDAVANWTFSVLPMFIFMGILLWKSGLTAQMYVAARVWLKWLPGGLAVSTNAAGTGLAAVSGSTLATTYALGRIGIPEMLRAGYDRRMAIASIMISGLPGQLIPPSTALVIYAGIAEVPIGPQLMAGIIPGLFVAFVFSMALILAATIWPSLVGGRSKNDGEVITWSQRWTSLAGIWPMPVLIGIVLGGMFAGVLTATEAGAAGALGALILTIIVKGKTSWRTIVDAGVDTIITSGAIFLLLIGAQILSSLLTLSGLADGFADWVSHAGFDRVTFLLIVLAVYLLLGTFMENLPIMLLTVPLLIPILGELDVSLLWFGVFCVFMGELAILTPPVGILSFVIHALCQEKEINLGQKITLNDVMSSVWYLMPIAVLVAVLLIFFPDLVTWLPDQMSIR
ncbi:TRAP transporter large permease subunit [Devosia ginsengisoli]|uniref:TRAP transporter large permease subunit n=1 Tax=Devosia ginsengisoli TaxID=400770 RepID=A0A5B8LMX7_9HYPH|nr:TRAP transporter large permease subunit [Devosia ginsengisoli]QDZ09493.1 TRAP transporter large permease subunit [Devosia ginsengisoli]